MKHFNGLNPAEAERLAVLAEECGEVIQAICKTLRHGYESTNPKTGSPETNRQMLQGEMGDLQHAMIRCIDAGDVSGFDISKRAAEKAQRITPYLHHQAPAPEKCPKCGGPEPGTYELGGEYRPCPACMGGKK